MSTDERLAAAVGECLRQHVDALPTTGDPFAGLEESLARDRRHRQVMAAGAMTAAVGLAAGALAGSGALSAKPHRPTASGSGPIGSASPTTTPTPTLPGEPVPTPTGPFPWPTWTDSDYAGWMPGWPLLFPHTGSAAAADAATEQLVAAYGKPVDAPSRAVVKEVMMAFTSCGYPLGQYTFKLMWVGDMLHSGDKGGAVLTVTLHSISYRMVAYNTYKGFLIEPAVQIDANEAAKTDSLGRVEANSGDPSFYSPVWAEPGSRVRETYDGRPFTATVGPTGVAELKLAGQSVIYPGKKVPAWPAQAVITHPDGSTSTVKVGSDGTDNTPDTSRVLLPPTSTCPGASYGSAH